MSEITPLPGDDPTGAAQPDPTPSPAPAAAASPSPILQLVLLEIVNAIPLIEEDRRRLQSLVRQVGT